MHQMELSAPPAGGLRAPRLFLSALLSPAHHPHTKNTARSRAPGVWLLLVLILLYQLHTIFSVSASNALLAGLWNRARHSTLPGWPILRRVSRALRVAWPLTAFTLDYPAIGHLSGQLMFSRIRK
jgi:hypothetical protein